MELPVAITVSSFIFSVGSTIVGGLVLFFKHLRTKRDKEAEQAEIANLKEKVGKLEDRCARLGDIENLKKSIDEVKVTCEQLRVELKGDIVRTDRERHEEIVRITERMEKLYEKVLEWLSEKK